MYSGLFALGGSRHYLRPEGLVHLGRLALDRHILRRLGHIGRLGLRRGGGLGQDRGLSSPRPGAVEDLRGLDGRRVGGLELLGGGLGRRGGGGLVSSLATTAP